MSVAIAVDVMTSESHTLLTFGVLETLTVLVCLATSIIDRFIKSFHPIEKRLSVKNPHRYLYCLYKRPTLQAKRKTLWISAIQTKKT